MGTEYAVGVRFTGNASSLNQAAASAASSEREVGRAGQQAGDQATHAFSRTKQGLESISTMLDRTRQQFIAFMGAAQLVNVGRGVGRMADEYANIGAQMRQASGESVAFAKAQDAAYGVAQRTTASLASTADLISRVNRSLTGMGETGAAAFEKSARLAESINQAVALSHVSASASDAALTQLSQGLASGVLRGDELNSVLEQTPRLAQAIADGMGITVGQLRAMGAEGLITSAAVVRALESQGATLEREYANLPLTIGRSWTMLVNGVERYVGQADQASGASRLLAGSLAAVANHIDLLVIGLEAVGAAAALQVGSKAVAAASAYAQQLASTVQAQAAAVAAERTAAAAAVDAARASAVKATANLQAVQSSRAVAAAELASAQADVVLAQRHLEAANAAGVLSYAQRQQRVATDALTAAKARQAAAINELAALGRMEAGVQGALSTAATAQVAAQQRLASAVTTSSLAMSGLRKVGGGVLAMMGGWPGVILAAGAALLYLATRQSEAERTADALETTTRQLADAHGRVTTAAIAEAEAQRDNAQASLDAAKARLAYMIAVKSSASSGISGATSTATYSAERDIKRLTNALAEFKEQVDKSRVAKAFQDNADTLASMARDEAQGFDAVREAVKKKNAEFEKQIATYGKGQAALQEYDLAQRIAAERAKGDTTVTRARIGELERLYATTIKNAQVVDAMTAASKRHTGSTREQTAAQRQAVEAARELARANQEIATSHAAMDEQITQLRERLAGLSAQQIEYNAGVRDAVAAYKEWIRAGIPMQQAQRELQNKYDQLNDRLQLKNALDEQDIKNTPAKVQSYQTQTSAAERYYQVVEQGAKSAADAIGNYFVHNVRGIADLWRGLVDAAKQVVAQIISTWLQLRVLQPLLGGVFGGGGGSGWLGMAGSVVGMAGGGTAGSGSSNVSSPGASDTGFADWIRNGVQSYKAYQWAANGGLWGSMGTGAGNVANVGIHGMEYGVGGVTSPGTAVAYNPWATQAYTPVGGVGWGGVPYASYAGGALGAYYGAHRGDGGVGTVASTVGYGALGAGIAGTAAGVAGGASVGAAATGAFGAAAASTSWIPIVGWIMAALAVVDSVSGGKVFGTKYQTGQTDMTLKVGAEGASAAASAEQWKYKGQVKPSFLGSLFGGIPDALHWGDKSRRHVGLETTPEMTAAAQQLYDGLRKTMVTGAQKLAVDVPAMIEASLDTQSKYNKKGKLQSTDYIVEYMGRTWKEATAEAAAKRIGAEALISVVQQSAGAVAQTISEGFRKSADTLADAADTMLAAQTDIVRGNALVALGSSATLKQVIGFVQGLQADGEKLADTYTRLMQASQAYTQFVGQFAPTSASFGASLQGIAKQMQANIDQANALAQAAGMQHAAESDLVNIHQRAAEQAAEAIAKLSSAAQDLATKLYAVTGSSLQAVQAQLDQMQGKVQSAMQLAIGDKSPLSAKEKLDVALQGLRSGLTSADDVLGLGRQLYASSADYTGLYNKVQEILGLPGASNQQSLQEALKQYNELAGQRDQLQGQANATARFADAKQLAQYLAEISTTHGVSYGEAAKGLGFSLGDLAKDLGITNIAGYLDSLKLQDITGSSLDASASIVDAIQRLGRDLIATLTGAPITSATGVSVNTNTSTAEQTALLKSIDQRLAAIEGSTSDTAATNKSMARDSTGGRLDRISRSTRGGVLA